MVQSLKRNLYFLMVGSLMFIFSIVFCLMVHENIKAKRNSELAYFNRMTTTLVLQLEHESDYQTCLNLYEERRDMYFQLSSDTGRSLYQSEYLGDNTDIIDTFLTTLLGTEGDFTFSPSSLKDYYYSRQSGAYTIEALNGKKYYCVNCLVVTDYGSIYTVTVIKEKSSFATLLKPKSGYYFCIWCGVLVSIICLSKILIRKAVKPTEKAMQSQKDFIAAVSHECKAPLAAILSSAEMIESVPNIPDTVTDHVRVIDAEVSRMSRLIRDLLLLSSIDAGNWSFHMDEVNVDTLLINLYTKFERICRKKDIQLQLNIPDECCPPLYSDADRLDQIISIFLDNAVSYSPPESEISLNASVRKNELIFTIIDHGIGISEKEKPFIFDRFYQSDKSRTQREHFGLGLSIANDLVHKLEGKIKLFDTPGGGCTFKIFLPLKQQ
ncbi:sensor histidine kinase ResE [Lachnospiraceae bacterium]|nr:sensor histidine kinase ResE [Lachnospiraceae bacterium]